VLNEGEATVELVGKRDEKCWTCWHKKNNSMVNPNYNTI